MRRFREVIPQLKSVRYDWIADLHHNLRTLRLKSALRRPGAAFPKLNVEKWLLTNFKIDLLPDLHIVGRYFKTVSRLGVQNDHAGLDFFISDEANVDIPGISNETIKPDAFIAMAIGAGRATKNLEDGQWLQLIDKMPLPVILLGGPADEDRGHQLAAHLSHCLNLAGKLSIQQSASVIAQSSCVISPDTGMMHIAAALKKPVLSVWGNTIPKFGMTPYYPADLKSRGQIFEVQGLPCRPCSKIGYDTCPKGHFKCIRSLDMDAITKAVIRIQA